MKKNIILNKQQAVVFFLFSALSSTGISSIAYAHDRDYAGQTAKISAPSSGDIIVEEPGLRNHLEHYTADRKALERYYPIPFSPASRERFKQLNQEWLGILANLDFGKLSLDGQVDFILLKNRLNHELLNLKNAAAAAAAVEPLLPFADKIIVLCEDLKKMHWIEAVKAAAALADLKNQIIATKESLEQRLTSAPKFDDIYKVIGVTKSVANSAASRADVLRNGLNYWFNFYNPYDPLFSWWAAGTYKETDQALQSYIDFLREKLVGKGADARAPIFMDPVGRDVVVDELAFEMIPYTPEEILAIGWQELAWCEKELIAASRELGFGDDWHKAMDHVKNEYIQPGQLGQHAEVCRFFAFEAIEFLEKHDQITIPQLAKDLWSIRMKPTGNFFGGGEALSVPFPTNTFSYEEKMESLRDNNPHFSRATVFHEAFPGHMFQNSYNAFRRRTYRNDYGTSFYLEGWPFYWEMRLRDMGFQKTPEDRVGMLFWRIYRAARIIFSISFQLGKMTGQECIDFVVNRVGMAPGIAADFSTIRAGDPILYRASYMVGGLQMRALSQELVDSGKMTAKAFHDAVLLENNLPIELLRAKLIKQKLSPEFVSKWKFYTFSPETGKGRGKAN